MSFLALALVTVLVTVLIAGCLDEKDPDSDPIGSADAPSLNPWQAGLADTHETPEHVKTRSAQERNGEQAPAGDPEFAAFDAAMEAWMLKHLIPAGQLAIMKDGKLRYERGYGHVDREQSNEANASTMMRIASITKPMTAALVALQVEEGLYNWSDPVFCLGPDPRENCRLPIDPHPQRPLVDDRLQDVQVGHLINHTAGWDRRVSGDPMFRTIEIAEDLGIASPPPAWRFAQWMLGAELDNDPGTTDVYSNFGYAVAGLVAEAASGTQLGALYDAYLFRPLELEGEIEPGHILPEHRNPREPYYACNGEMRNVYEPNETVCASEGGWSLEAQLAHGGLISTAAAVAVVYEAYGHHAPDLLFPGGPYGWTWHSGSLPGTDAVVTNVAEGTEISGDIQMAFTFNSRARNLPCNLAGAIPVLGSYIVPGCDREHFMFTMMGLSTQWGMTHAVTDTQTIELLDFDDSVVDTAPGLGAPYLRV